MESQQIVTLVIGIVLLGVLMFLPRWQAQRRRQQQMSALEVGKDILTVGGIVGTLTYFNTEENRARVEIAPGVEITILPAAIRGELTDDTQG
jgi:preprotein translocase subunit YajC